VLLETSTTLNGEPCFDNANGSCWYETPETSAANVRQRVRCRRSRTGKMPDFEPSRWRPRQKQALLYRLSGDLNSASMPIPASQAAPVFEQGPILHGLCTYGFVARRW